MANTIDNNVDISCKFQEHRLGGMTCKASYPARGSKTDIITPEHCLHCEIGKIYRELGCKVHLNGYTVLSPIGDRFGRANSYMVAVQAFCNLRNRDTTYSFCQRCPYISGEFVKPVISKALSIMEQLGFSESREDLLKSVNDLNTGEYEGAITNATTAVQTTLETAINKLKLTLPSDKNIKNDWRTLKESFDFGLKDRDEALNMIRSCFESITQGLSLLRKDASEAHTGSGDVPPSLAELTVYLAASFSNYIINRYLEIKDMKNTT